MSNSIGIKFYLSSDLSALREIERMEGRSPAFIGGLPAFFDYPDCVAMTVFDQSEDGPWVIVGCVVFRETASSVVIDHLVLHPKSARQAIDYLNRWFIDKANEDGFGRGCLSVPSIIYREKVPA